MTTDSAKPSAPLVDFDAGALPPTVVAYLEAQRERSLASVADRFTADAVVTDDGSTFRGLDEVTRWLGRAASEFTYTTTTAAQRVSAPDRIYVVARIEGDFPGGRVDLGYDFTVDGDLISRLTIEPHTS